jgi:TetR/AcrR family transcriptional repressor of nem operon
MAVDAARRGDRRGCFLCNAAVDRAGDDAEAAEFVTVMLKRIEDAIAAALSDHPLYGKNPGERRRAAQRILADYLGMRVLARSGAPVAALRNIREGALATL